MMTLLQEIFWSGVVQRDRGNAIDSSRLNLKNRSFMTRLNRGIEVLGTNTVLIWLLKSSEELV